MVRAVTAPKGDDDDIYPLCVGCGWYGGHYRIVHVGAPDCDAADVVQGEAPVAAGARQDLAFLRQAGSVLRVRREDLLPFRRCARRGRRTPPRGVPAPRGDL